MSTQDHLDAPPKKVDEWHENDEILDQDAVALAATYTPGSDAEKALVRKIDKRIIPCIWILYTLSYLDRANIGNAKTGGLESHFKLTSSQYSIVLLVFFISYVVFEVPSNLLIARLRPSLYLSGLCIVWGGVAACMGATHNYQQLAGVRFTLGVLEAGFAPGVAFYLSSWYKRYELASRFSIYYTATAVSGAFSGLLAGVITQHLDGARGIEGWRWLFIIEGVGSSFVGCFTWYFMPDWPSTTKFLSGEERVLAAQRLAFDGLANTGGAQGHIGHWQAIKMCVTDWRTWMFVFLYMLCTGAQTIQYFVPTLIGAIGWTGYTGQYHTIPLYAAAFVFILTFCFTADRLQRKPEAILLASSMGVVFFIIVVATTKHMVQYVFLILAFGCVYALPPLILTWVPNIIGHPAEKRAVSIALVNALGNSASIYGVFLWPKTDAPRYIPGFSATTVFMGLITIGTILMKFLLAKYPAEQLDSEKMVLDEIEKQRAQGRLPPAQA
ncbi:nicotinamide mononucleotide permease [Kwoniella mangroviensis CBS 10435]|uniref:Nicotinamide mononucleotide permease n=1 Tax=Kwoniella mangroviensis CBS 10435 TaxID=1331196 RepID=A0A1B9IH36_9TREE|nr:nicotinamide mononucleotide permease [Kwoniella mangroviensis CBS 8507]OCF54684.1 nicotinamide mononucleotide permease [Kwoniella mangroviensis CBS 10435]OCF63801.1 nicotinamide mononucleotide permease [Kwoniella mangroviensis CBS 8507]